MGKWAVRRCTVRISGLHCCTATYYKIGIRRQLEKEFGPIEKVIILDETEYFSEAFAIFEKPVCAKNAVAARTIAIRDETLSISEPSNDECSRVGLWCKSHAGLEAWPTSPSSSLRRWRPYDQTPRQPYNQTRWQPYNQARWQPHNQIFEPDSPIHEVVQSPTWSIPPQPPRAMANSTISPLPTTPGDSISSKPSQLLKPSAGARQLSLGPRSYSSTQSSNQADPVATNASHNKSAVTTGITVQVTTSTRTEPSQQYLNHLSASMTTASMHPSGSIDPNLLHTTAAGPTGAPSCASPPAPSSAPVMATSIRSSSPPTSASTTSMISKPVPSSAPLDAMLVPKIQVHSPPDPTLGAAPVAASVFSGSHNNLSSAMVPSAIAFATVQGGIPTQDHPMPFAFQGQPQTGARALNSTSSLNGRGGPLGASTAPSLGSAHPNSFSNVQPPLSSYPTKAGQPFAFTFPPSNTPASVQQGPLNSKYQNPFGPLPPLVTTPVHSHPQSVSGQQWIGDKQGALRYSTPVSRRLLSDPMCFSVDQGDSKTVSITQEQFRTARTMFEELYKANEEAVNAHSKAIEKLESERKKSEELSRRLGDAEKVVEQMKREQENSAIQHREELDLARKANTEQMKAVTETINEKWKLKLQENEERLVQAKRQANEERELSSTREEALRSHLRQGLEVQREWMSTLEAVKEERLRLLQELVDLKQAFLLADAGVQVEISRRQELERELDDSWAKERARPELVKAFLLLEGMAQKVTGPRDIRVTGSAGPDTAQNPVKVGDTPESSVAKRQRLQ